MARHAGTVGGVIQRLLDAVWFVVLAGGAIIVVVVMVALALGGHPRVEFPVALTVRRGRLLHGPIGSASVMGAGGQLSVKAPSEVVVVGWGSSLWG